MDQANDETHKRLEQLIDGYADTQYVALAAQLGIADLLAEGPLSADALAEATHSHPDALYRALRAMAARGIFLESGERVFALTPLAQFLRRDHADSLRGVAIRAGGQGVLLAAILQAYPTMSGVLFDLPYVVANAEPLLQEAGVSERCKVVGGDFFESVPSGGDLYTLRWIIHDWEDEPAVTILRNCLRAMNPQGKVALIEMLIGEPNSAELGPLMDLDMLLIPGGRERTAEEFQRLFTAAGLRLTRIVPTQGFACVLEAERA
jgi:hypothetical protein